MRRLCPQCAQDVCHCKVSKEGQRASTQRTPDTDLASKPAIAFAFKTTRARCGSSVVTSRALPARCRRRTASPATVRHGHDTGSRRGGRGSDTQAHGSTQHLRSLCPRRCLTACTVPLLACVCADVACTSWLQQQSSTSLCPKEYRAQVYALIQRVRTAEECGLLAQLELFLNLYLLRELLDSFSMVLPSSDGCEDSVMLDSPSGTQSLDQSDEASSAALPQSCSLFGGFLLWTYGDVEARTRHCQLQRLANWFRLSTDVAFFQRLCSGSITQQPPASKAEAGSLETKIRQPRLCPLSISYFYLLAPRLPDLQYQCTGEAPLVEIESRLISYLSIRPLLLFQRHLATDFDVNKRSQGQRVRNTQVVPISPTLSSASAASAMSMLTKVVLDKDVKLDARSAVAASAEVDGNEIDSSAEALLESMARAGTDGNGAGDLPAPPEEELDEEDASDAPQPDGSADDDEDEDDASSAVEASRGHAASTVVRSRRKTKRKRAEPKLDRAAAAPAAAPPPPVVIPCLTRAHAVPIELLLLGVSAWIRKRQQVSENAAHRQAMDVALVDLMWELSEELSDGDRLLVPEFKRARRSASRVASAAYHQSVEGDRGCNLLHNVLDKLLQAAPSSSPHASTS